MPTKEQIENALSQVIDPELGGNIVELGMVREIRIEDGKVNILLALTMLGCPLREQIKQQTQSAATAVPGVKDVTVEITAMNEDERQKLKGRLSPAMNMNRVERVVAVMSGKGGVGKSSITALLATALQREGYATGVLDADITGPSIPRLFGISGPVRCIPMGILPVVTRTGIRVISTNLMLPEEDMAILWRGPIMSNTIQQFWRDVLWARLDYLLVDLPPGTSDATLTVMQSLPLDGVVMVTTPQSLSSMVVRKTVHMAQSLEVPVLGIIENMSYFVSPDTGARHLIFGASNTEAVSKLAKAPILSHFPIDPNLAQLADAGEIEKYENPAIQELLSSFLETVPPLEPALTTT
jgi:Mrp family chromosome partitioning ATPase